MVLRADVGVTCHKRTQCTLGSTLACLTIQPSMTRARDVRCQANALRTVDSTPLKCQKHLMP